MSDFKIKKLINYQMDENTYVVYEGKHGVIIDPGASAKTVADFCKEEGIEVEYIMLTHCHYDHMCSAEELRSITGAKIACGRGCALLLHQPEINLSIAFGDKEVILSSDISLSEGDTLTAGDMEFSIIETPGHTSDSVCYRIDDVVFTGDTIFKMNVGRWDLPTGDQEALKRSVREKIYTMPNSYRLLPGHGDDTSVSYERQFNPWIKPD